MATPLPDRSKRVIVGGLAIFGVILALVGWYNYFSR